MFGERLLGCLVLLERGLHSGTVLPSDPPTAGLLAGIPSGAKGSRTHSVHLLLLLPSVCMVLCVWCCYVLFVGSLNIVYIFFHSFSIKKILKKCFDYKKKKESFT